MDLHRFQPFFTPAGYLNLIKRIIYRKEALKEVEDLREQVPDQYAFNRTLELIGKKLWELSEQIRQSRGGIVYPLEMIPVPCFPFSKKPMISWTEVQWKEYHDPDVNKLKEFCGRLVYQINVSFVLRRFVLIDFDFKDAVSRKYGEIETRRGFHILRYVPEAEQLLVYFEGSSVESAAVVDGRRIDILSGPGRLGRFPLQTFYLELDTSGKFPVKLKRYKILKKEIQYALESADLTPIKATPSDIRAMLQEIFKELGKEDLARRVQVKVLEKGDFFIQDSSPKRTSKPNVNGVPRLGTLSYGDFKFILEKHVDELPECLRQFLFGIHHEKGYWYFLERTAIPIVNSFVMVTDDTVKEIAEDFFRRVKRRYTKSDVKAFIYKWKYFSGRLEFNGKVYWVPSRAGPPPEAWIAFEEMGFCTRCRYHEKCSQMRGGERVRMMRELVERIVLDELEKDPSLGDSLDSG